MTDWQAFYLIDPWGDQRADLRAGITAAATVNGNPFRRGSAAQPKDFMPFRDGDRGRITLTTPDEMEAFFRAYCDAYGE